MASSSSSLPLVFEGSFCVKRHWSRNGNNLHLTCLLSAHFTAIDGAVEKAKAY